MKDAATWRDSLLIGKVDAADFLTAKADAADCQKLLDGRYSDEFLGEPSGASALTATDSAGDRRTVQVTETSVPDEGDARQGLRVTVQGTSSGTPAALTLEGHPATEGRAGPELIPPLCRFPGHRDHRAAQWPLRSAVPRSQGRGEDGTT
ncbi:hypothetical protein [Streptomyces sp. NBC_00663]|uniref:hypothetical protein n=1 Tax=Streptomyces sp. NBC_00663 TaxID=2975801 RepID=UPI002E350061|nr:hypothetical protein [Streptomyces sp. NBC_00663]